MKGRKVRKWEVRRKGNGKPELKEVQKGGGGCTLLDKNETVRVEIESEACCVDEFPHIP